ncbi:MAG: Holliday junction branch migration protein RuvA [Defluviitaleaceae bacterium]|nr:Holliday junction branch migration protein RuvA [Defluviitaleaceae bacterium]
MISFIKGTLEIVYDNSVVIENNGVGYQIYVNPATLSGLPRIGDEVKLFTYLQVREDGLFLHGFLTNEEVRIFLLLISVSGIGPKIAATLLAMFSPVQIMVGIFTDDALMLSKAPGIGKKTAMRICLELRDKIKSHDAFGSDDGIKTSASSATEANSQKQDAIDALLSLGYGRSEAVKAVMETAEDEMSAELIIKMALKKMVK